jgi:uncharacterized protein YcnI
MGAATAHVTISPPAAQHGTTAELTFRVPNEASDAATVKIQIQIPTSSPIAQLLARPVPGWTVSEHTVKLPKPLVTDDGTFTKVVDLVTWSGGRIEPGQYQDFALSADPLPDVGTQIAFKTLQSYSNGDIVRWIDLQQPGQPTPAHPAPVLTLTSHAISGNSIMVMGPATQAPPAAGSQSSWPGVVAVIALAVALLSLGVVVELLRRPRSGE